MLDHLSGGRLELGYFGVDAADTRAIFTEVLAVLLCGLT
jgi:hypothetical protein